MRYFINPMDLVDGHVYELKSRNLTVGVWKQEHWGFIGIRRKFDSEYLFTEYEYDLAGPPYGTARAVRDLGVKVRKPLINERVSDAGNPELFDLLKPLHNEVLAAWRAEDERLSNTERDPRDTLRVDPQGVFRLPPEIGARNARANLDARRYGLRRRRKIIANTPPNRQNNWFRFVTSEPRVHGKTKHDRDVLRFHEKRLARTL